MVLEALDIEPDQATDREDLLRACRCPTRSGMSSDSVTWGEQIMWGFAHQWLVDPWGYGGYGPFHIVIWIILVIVFMAGVAWRVVRAQRQSRG